MSPTDMLQLDAKNTGLVGARTHSHFFGRDHWAIKCVWGTHGSRNHQLSFRCNLALSLYIENKWDYFSILPGNNHVYWWIGFHTLFSYNTHFFPVLCKCKKQHTRNLCDLRLNVCIIQRFVSSSTPTFSSTTTIFLFAFSGEWWLPLVEPPNTRKSLSFNVHASIKSSFMQNNKSICPNNNQNNCVTSPIKLFKFMYRRK